MRTRARALVSCRMSATAPEFTFVFDEPLIPGIPIIKKVFIYVPMLQDDVSEFKTSTPTINRTDLGFKLNAAPYADFGEYHPVSALHAIQINTRARGELKVLQLVEGEDRARVASHEGRLVAAYPVTIKIRPVEGINIIDMFMCPYAVSKTFAESEVWNRLRDHPPLRFIIGDGVSALDPVFTDDALHSKGSKVVGTISRHLTLSGGFAFQLE